MMKIATLSRADIQIRVVYRIGQPVGTQVSL